MDAVWTVRRVTAIGAGMRRQVLPTAGACPAAVPETGSVEGGVGHPGFSYGYQKKGFAKKAMRMVLILKGRILPSNAPVEGRERWWSG
jgi:hypothetical protein